MRQGVGEVGGILLGGGAILIQMRQGRAAAVDHVEPEFDRGGRAEKAAASPAVQISVDDDFGAHARTDSGRLAVGQIPPGKFPIHHAVESTQVRGRAAMLGRAADQSVAQNLRRVVDLLEIAGFVKAIVVFRDDPGNFRGRGPGLTRNRLAHLQARLQQGSARAQWQKKNPCWRVAHATKLNDLRTIDFVRCPVSEGSVLHTETGSRHGLRKDARQRSIDETSQRGHPGSTLAVQ